jgi:hypothetical protein
LLSSPAGVSNSDGCVCRRSKADEGRVDGLLNLLGDLSRCASVDSALGLDTLLSLSVNLGGLGLQVDRNRSLLCCLVESLA